MRKVAGCLVVLLLGCLAFAQSASKFPRRSLDCDEGTGVLCSEVYDPIGRYRTTDAMGAPIGNLAQETPKVLANETLEQALESLVDHELQGLPVLSGDGNRIVGWLTHRDVLRAYYDRSRNNGRQARA